MASQYNTRKEMLSSPKTNLVEVEHVQRSVTPKPVCRTIEKEEVSTKKLMYKHELKNELESFKSKLEAVEQLHTDLTQKFSDLTTTIEAKIDENKKAIDGFKIENLKNVLNDSILKVNEQLKSISAHLILKGDTINELDCRLKSIEDLI